MDSFLSQSFENIENEISSMSTFKEAFTHSRVLFTKSFKNANEENQRNFLNELFRWSQEKLHYRKTEDRLAALVGFSYYVDIEEDHNQLILINQNLERILPLESVILIDGIAHLVKRISRVISIPIIPKLFERCFSWLTARTTRSGVLSSVFLMHHLFTIDPNFFIKFSSEFTTAITALLKIGLEETQKPAVDLFQQFIEISPQGNQIVSTEITTIIYSPPTELPRYLLLLKSFLKNNNDVCNEKANDIFTSIISFLNTSPIPEHLQILVKLCKVLNDKAQEISNSILSLFQNNDQIDFKNPKICMIYSKILRVMPKTFSLFGNSLLPTLVNNMDCFFIIATSIIDCSPELVDRNLFLDKMQHMEFNEYSINFCSSYFTAFKEDSFRIISIFVPKLNESFENNNSIKCILQLITKLSIITEFPIEDYWEFVFNIFNNSSNENIKIISIQTLFIIIHRFDYEKQKKLLSLLLSLQNNLSSKLKITLCNSIDDSLLSHFSDHSLFFMAEQLYEDDNYSVKISTLDLISRIQNFTPLSTMKFFQTKLKQFPFVYFQIPLKRDRMQEISLLPLIIQSSGSFARSHQTDLIKFIIEILNSKVETSLTLPKRVIYKFEQKYDQKIRIYSLKSITALANKKACDKDMLFSIISSIVEQFFIYKKTSIHLSATESLKSLFRNFPITKLISSKKIVKFHQRLYQFLKTSTNSRVNILILQLLGTIGALDPHQFHNPKTPIPINESYPLYDSTNREQSTLNYVMKYILGQLKDGKPHELPVLINALTYIFQSDSQKCLIYLEDVIKLINSFHVKPELIASDDLLHFLTTIILVVDVAILPYKDDIYKLVLPYLKENTSIDAIKLLCALIFAIKCNFKEYGPNTFKIIYDLIQKEEDSNNIINYLLALTLIVIYADGSIRLYFDLIQKYVYKNDITSEFAITFLCQTLRNCSFPQIVLPSFHLACNFINTETHLQYISIRLIELLIIRFTSIMFSLPINLSELHPEISKFLNEITSNSAFEFLRNFDAVPDPYPIRSKPSIKPSSLSQVFSRGRLQSSVSENDWSSWLLQITQELVLCSNSPAIRASHPLLRVSSDFERGLFPFVIVSVWDISSENDRSTLSNYLLEIVHNSHTPTNILEIIISACEAMDRAQFTLFTDPLIIGQIAERCNSWFIAIRFYEKNSILNIETIQHLLRIQSLLKRKECALGLLSIVQSPNSNCELLEALSMWKQARDVYSQKLKETKCNENYLIKYLSCSMLIEDWQSIIEKFDDFKTYSKDIQAQLAIIFVAAARNSKLNPHEFLLSIKNDDPITCIFRTLVALDFNQLNTAKKWVQKGLKMLSMNFSSFLSGTYEPSIPIIYKSMIFEELKDIIYQRENKITSKEILLIWKSKANYINRDPTQLGYIHKVRELLQCNEEEMFEINFDYVNSLRRSQEWTLFNNCYNNLFTNNNAKENDKIKLLQAKYRYDNQLINNYDEFIEIINKENINDEIYCDAVCSYTNRCPINPNAIPLLKKVIEIQPTKIRAWKNWAFFNLGCAQNNEYNEIDRVNYASNAINGFAKLISLTRPSLHFLCHLCNLFFTFGSHLTNFKNVSKNLISLSPSSVIQIIPQLMVQFDHKNEEVRKVVYKIVENFSINHFQALAMPLCLVKRTPTSSKTLLTFIEQMGEKHYEVMKDAEIFTNAMLHIAVTAVEEAIVLLERAVACSENEKYEKEVMDLLKQVLNIMDSTQSQFVKNIFTFSKISYYHDRLSSIFQNNNNINNIKPKDKVLLYNTSHGIKSILQLRMEAITTIDINELDLNIVDQPFSLAIPGFYSVNKAPATIKSIGHVMKLIPSAKRPRKLRIIGSDGINYKYLLKGREDLRLDQRIMQLFSLANSILHDDKFGIEKHLHIRQVPIVPIAPNAGLIVWAEGGETLYSMISWHRKVLGIIENKEQQMLREYVGNNHIIGEKEATLRLNIVQKLELHREVCSCYPDDDIRETLWLKSQNAEIWLNKITNFSRSNGLMSIIGYIMGIGDRHPSNILVMKGTGNVVHIDFSDCFEKANLRAYVHETVPFRLTRMIVRAFGASGVNGVFSMTAEYVMKLMRKNKDALLAFLDIFVQDPITDTIWYKNAVDFTTKWNGETEEKGAMLKRAIARVNDKLCGQEFGEILNVHDQVQKLIEMATDELNLAQMYYGWAPFW